MSLRDLIILSVALIIWGIVMGTGLLLLIAPDRAPRLWWIGHALLTEEDLRTPWRRINARLTGALVVVMCAYMLWGFFLGGGSQESSVSRSVEAGEVKRMVFPTTLFGWLIWFFSWFVVPLVMFWVFVIDSLRMLIRPAKWVSNTRRGKKYWPRMQRSGVTIRQLRVLGFVLALGGTMISDAQINANRRNALKSTGPRTTAGKQAVRLNALWHGAIAVDPLLPGEDPAAFSQSREKFRRMYQPVSQAEETLVDRIVLACWRLQRLGSMQSVVLCALDSPRSSGPSFIRSLKRFVLGQAEPPEPDPEEAGAPDALTCACITLGKLGRYESAHEDSFYRALHDLELLRSVRRGQPSAVSRQLIADS